MNKETLTVNTAEDGTVTYRNAEGDLHNPDGPAVVWDNGDKFYYINGELHNENGPAVVYADGDTYYWINDKLHNPDGPAVVFADGYKAYYINGRRLSETKFKTWQAEQTAK